MVELGSIGQMFMPVPFSAAGYVHLCTPITTGSDWKPMVHIHGGTGGPEQKPKD